MRRFAMDKLLDWKKKSNRKPLILMGARQVGKTWLMKEFGKTYYEKTAYISFYNNQRMQAVFDTDFDIKRIIMNLNIESGVTITPENTLIVLDEIQNAPKALESLKYFCEEAPEYHVIAAGSLLGVALHEGISYPVGKVDLLDLYPFNFREFLCAMDEEGLENALETKDYNLIDNFADKYLFWLKNYYYTGGMPAVVDHRHRQPGPQGRQDIGEKVGGGHQVDVLDALVDELEKDPAEVGGSQGFSEVFPGNLHILAEAAPEGAAGEEHGAGAVSAGDHRFLPVVGGGPGGVDLAGHPAEAQRTGGAVDAAAAGAEGAVGVGQHDFTSGSSIPQRDRRGKGVYAGGKLCYDKVVRKGPRNAWK